MVTYTKAIRLESFDFVNHSRGCCML